MEIFLQDLRYGLRVLFKKPGFAIVTVMTLAVAIAANCSIFSVVNAVLLKPLPYSDPAHLVMIWETIPSAGVFENTPAPVNYAYWRDNNQILEKISAFQFSIMNLTGAGDPERIDGARVTGGTFGLLGVEPVLGRNFLPEEDKPGANRVAIIGNSLWNRRFASDPNVIGKEIFVNDQKVTIVGVMPPSFEFPVLKSQIWMPMAMTAEYETETSRSLWVMGRLKSNISPKEAQTEMTGLVTRYLDQHPEVTFHYGINVVSFDEQIIGGLRSALMLLFLAAGFILLIACANVANLLLTHAAARQKEIAIRAALGAGRWRLLRQLFTEGILLAGFAGGAGLILAFVGIKLLVSQMPRSIAQAKSANIDFREMAFTAAITIFVGILCSLAPAIQSFKPMLNETLKGTGRGNTGTNKLVRSFFVVAEIALALILLIGGSLILKSFYQLSHVDPGFDHDNLLTAEIMLSPEKYNTQEKRSTFFREVVDKLQAVPGVQSVGLINGLPVSFQGRGTSFKIEGRPDEEAFTPLVAYRIINNDYFKTMKIPVITGRAFEPQDRTDTQPVAVIGESLAKKMWPNQSPLGQRMKWAGFGDWITIVGTVKDIRLSLFGQAYPHVYLPYTQMTQPPEDVVIRTSGKPTTYVTQLRNAIWEVDRNQPIANIQTMDQIMSDSIARQHFNMLLLVIFAVVALFLAAAGIYGVLSYTVAQSTREIGIRAALGAKPADIRKLVIGQGLLLAIIGVGLGFAGSFALSSFIASLLHNVKPSDPMVLASVPCFLIAVAVAACYLPARGASKVDPMVALRYE